MSERVSVPTDAGEQPAHLWLPPRGRGPGIVLMQEIFGVSAYIRRRGAQLAELGYVVLAPEVYWRLGAEAMQPIEGEHALQEGMAVVRRLDWEAAVSDGAAAVSALRGREEVTGGVGLLGFCFGGGLAFDVAARVAATDADGAADRDADGAADQDADGAADRAGDRAADRDAAANPDGEPGGVDALVSYYGSALPDLVDRVEVSAPSLHHFGLADEFIALESIRHVEASVTRQLGTTFVTYPGANHAFDNDDAPWFDAEASALAWARTQEFLAERLPLGSR